ncbi:DUF4251 domain-containing protein [Maribacter sp. 2304DJ31-5]|uniref:DUF4251 domain-containing protein n=1 Tax=Maribacter sp. 2304DJ31-5 TaxID=3386273 RepID=UPI0039BD6EE4
MGRKILWINILFILSISCGTKRTVIGNNKILDALIESNSFEITVTKVQPLVTNALNQIASSGLIPLGSTINQINLNGASNFIRIVGDSISANLPYYGERQMGGGYNQNAGIQFNGRPKNLEILKDRVKQDYTITFRIRNTSESYNVNAIIHSNLSSSITITSSHRSVIRYTGYVTNYEEL